MEFIRLEESCDFIVCPKKRCLHRSNYMLMDIKQKLDLSSRKKNSIDPIPLFIAKYQLVSFHTFPLDTRMREKGHLIRIHFLNCN